MNELSTDRNPVVIAAEINSIKEQTRSMILASSIEIGRRLTEAKAMVPHGEWGKWLETSVDYSHDTAANLMKIYKEYGNSNFESIRNLSYTKAIALLGVPTEEREQFVRDNDLLNITVKKLQQAIQEREQAEKESQEFREGLDNAKNYISEIAGERDKLQKEKEKAELEAKNTKLTLQETQKQLSEAQASGNHDEIERLSESLAKTENDLGIAQQKINEFERQLKETPIEVSAAPVIEKIPDDVQKELTELRKQTSKPIKKFTACFDNLVTGFGNLLAALTEITDQQDHEKYKHVVKGLIEKMSERL